MATNGVGLSESIVIAPQSNQSLFPYRSGMGMIPSAEWAVFFDDFTQSAASNVARQWLATIIDTGATLTTDTTAADGATGVVIGASGVASEGVVNYQNKVVQLTSGKKFFMEARVKTSTAAETDVFIGLSDLTAVVNPEDLWTTTAANLVAFGTLAGSAYPSMLADKSNSGTSAQTQTSQALSNATWHILGIYYNGTNLYGYVDGKLALTWGSAASTIPTGVALSPFFGMRTGATAGNTVKFDYVRFVLQR